MGRRPGPTKKGTTTKSGCPKCSNKRAHVLWGPRDQIIAYKCRGCGNEYPASAAARILASK